MKSSDAIKYYSDKKIQEELVRFGAGREVIPRFGESGFGKRPAILLYPEEIFELARNGATSFHCSEEIWLNPMQLNINMPKKEQDELRQGWDLLIDIDSADFNISTKTAYLVIEALKFHNIQHASIKFSGNKGWHIGLPFSSLPESVDGTSITQLFPDAPRIIAIYLKQFISKTLEKELGNSASEKVELDTILLSPRHLFRMPYSLHEKSGLVSLPINIEEISNFKKEMAAPNKITIMPFLQEGYRGEAANLFKRAYAWHSENIAVEENKRIEARQLPSEAISEQFFPPCIKKLLEGVKDGRKRSVFILINFLKCAGWKLEDIETLLMQWNDKNAEPLRKGYIISQLNWHKKLKEAYPPPNCDSPMYYIALGVCCKDDICLKIRNPAAYPFLRIKGAVNDRRRTNIQKAKRNTKRNSPDEESNKS